LGLQDFLFIAVLNHTFRAGRAGARTDSIEQVVNMMPTTLISYGAHLCNQICTFEGKPALRSEIIEGAAQVGICILFGCIGATTGYHDWSQLGCIPTFGVKSENRCPHYLLHALTRWGYHGFQGAHAAEVWRQTRAQQHARIWRHVPKLGAARSPCRMRLMRVPHDKQRAR